MACAIPAKPTVLVLDDTLSALDVHTEAKVTGGLRGAGGRHHTRCGASGFDGSLLADRVALLDTLAGPDGAAHTIPHRNPDEAATVPRYRYLLAADDELDDGCEPQPDWEADDARARRTTPVRLHEGRTVARRPAGYVSSEGGAR